MIVPHLSLRRRLGLLAVGLGCIASSCGLIAGAGAATPQDRPTTTTPGHSSTTVWRGSGTFFGFCDAFGAGLSGIPPGDEGWQFVLTGPDPGPWELTATFAHSGTIRAAGTQNGHGSVNFVVTTSAGDQLRSASSTNGGHDLFVSGCTLGPRTTHSTTLWRGGGTFFGFCAGFGAGLSGVPPGEQGWFFVLTDPDPGPWVLTANFAHSGTIRADGTQNGNGSVQFVVITSTGDHLRFASSTNGGRDLVVAGCTLGPKVCPPYGPCTQPTTVTTTTFGHGHPFTRPVTFNPHGPATAIAFTGAELALLATIGAVAIGLGGMLVLASRRRRARHPYGSGRR